MIEFRYSGDGGFSASAGGALFDGDGGWQAGDRVDIRFFQLLDKLACVGVEAVEIASLAFAEEKIESEGAFTRTG